MSFTDMSSHELAAALRSLQTRASVDSAWLARLDRAAWDWKNRYTQLTEPYGRFVNAQYDWRTKPTTRESWEAVGRAASGLATALAQLGDIRLPRCKAKVYHSAQGPCNMLLDAKGECPGRSLHM